VRREWEPEDVVACWTLVEADRELIANKTGATRLGFTPLLKFFELEGRFPRQRYWSGRQVKRTLQDLVNGPGPSRLP
jgi:hypothetical protein